MSRRWAFRKDANHGAIVKAMARLGAEFVDMSNLGASFDGVMFIGSRDYWVEIKDGSKPPSARKLTDGEGKIDDILRRHGRQLHVIESEDDLVRLVNERQ